MGVHAQSISVEVGRYPGAGLDSARSSYDLGAYRRGLSACVSVEGNAADTAPLFIDAFAQGSASMLIACSLARIARTRPAPAPAIHWKRTLRRAPVPMPRGNRARAAGWWLAE